MARFHDTRPLTRATINKWFKSDKSTPMTYTEFLQKEQTKKAFVDYYSGKINGDEFRDTVLFMARKLTNREQEALRFVLKDVPVQATDAVHIDSAGSILHTIYDIHGTSEEEVYNEPVIELVYQIKMSVYRITPLYKTGLTPKEKTN